MKYYDITYKTPVVFDGGYPDLGKLIAMQVHDDATTDHIEDRAKFLLSYGATWDINAIEILTVVETPEENRPGPHPQGDFIVD
jgi:hypothetical protein